eukprot:10157156-Alexandrium_andersonii.AAC.1
MRGSADVPACCGNQKDWGDRRTRAGGAHRSGATRGQGHEAADAADRPWPEMREARLLETAC